MSPIALSTPPAFATVSWTRDVQRSQEDCEDYALFGLSGIASYVRVPNRRFVAVLPDLQPVRETVTSFHHLDDNWDTYGGRPTTKLAVQAALSILDGVSHVPATATEVLPFHTAPLGNGGLQLEWRQGRDALEIEIGNTGVLNVLFDRPGAPQRFEERDAISLEEALQLLRTFLTV